MTKFEEEFKALTSWDWVNVDLIQQILTRFGNWHSDEEFQELFDKYSNLNDSYEKEVIKSSKLESQIIDLKSQLQQQALPVVPDFIGKLINTFGAPEDGKHINYSASYLENQKELDWIDNHQKTWLTALLIGFRVEKPQLFYLKNKLTGAYLYYDEAYGEATNLYSDIFGNVEDFFGTKTKFTKQEIDSMETGSYELVPVEDGE
ncbi:DUF1642 domain-containing protein [Lactococcus lactis subsp. lactis]|uniref:DUF1642 domain-containing protein n=1 Tax=Lactococcus lactis TaxID=1358 RepID=UPI00300E5FB8